MDPQKWLDVLKELLLRAGVSSEVQLLIYRIVLITTLFYGVLWILNKIVSLLKPIISSVRLLSSRTKRKQIKQRQQFAEMLEYELKRFSLMDDWNDNSYTELEAEIEAEGEWILPSWFPFWKRKYYGVRRENSLTQALLNSTERVILLRGEPGAGKSIALRHLAAKLTHAACSSRDLNAVIPVYVNLKELNRLPGQDIDHHLIRNFVLGALNRLNDHEIESFLLSEFDRGIRAGTWLFLFDSFDEIPEVLSSTNADKNVQAYSSAISDFLHGMNRCRGIVASRYYRGPQHVGWPRFTILGLTFERMLWLVKNAGLSSDAEQELMVGLNDTNEAILAISSNPLFLGLLCEYVGSGQAFPESVHMVFEAYVETRLARDQKRLEATFGTQPEEVRRVAEQVGFIMSFDESIGLSPLRSELKDALRREKFTIHRYFDRSLDALESVKLARADDRNGSSAEKTFTFVHRRFQEYFATCVVLQNPERVSPRTLLSNGRWRETTVTLFQTRPLEDLHYVVEEAKKMTIELLDGVEGLIEKPIEYIETEIDKPSVKELYTISLPDKLYHLFGLLQSGLGKRANQLPDEITLRASQVVLTANEHSPLYEKAWALDVAGIINESVLHWILRDALISTSKLIRDIAFQQTSNLHSLPKEISNTIKEVLFNSRRKYYYTLMAYAKRLPSNSVMVEILQIKSTRRRIIRIADPNGNSDDFEYYMVVFMLVFSLVLCSGIPLLIYPLVNLPLLRPAWYISILLLGALITYSIFEVMQLINYFAYWRLLYEHDHILNPSERLYAPFIYLNYFLRSVKLSNPLKESESRDLIKELNKKLVEGFSKLKEEIRKLKEEFRRLPSAVRVEYFLYFGISVFALIMVFLDSQGYFQEFFQHLDMLWLRIESTLNSFMEKMYLTILEPLMLPILLILGYGFLFVFGASIVYVLFIIIPYVITFLLVMISIPIDKAWTVYFSLRDEYFLKWIKRAEQKTLYINSFAEIHEILCDFSEVESILNFLYLVRINQLISPSPDMMNSLAELSLKLESINRFPEKLRRKREPIAESKLAISRKYVPIITETIELNKHLYSHEPETGLRYSILHDSELELIEEINLLLNQIRSYQKD